MAHLRITWSRFASNDSYPSTQVDLLQLQTSHRNGTVASEGFQKDRNSRVHVETGAMLGYTQNVHAALTSPIDREWAPRQRA